MAVQSARGAPASDRGRVLVGDDELALQGLTPGLSERGPRRRDGVGRLGRSRVVRLRRVESVVDLCRQMGIQVVAQGIESPLERDTHPALGCELFQGYLFARPDRGFAYVRSQT